MSSVIVSWSRAGLWQSPESILRNNRDYFREQSSSLISEIFGNPSGLDAARLKPAMAMKADLQQFAEDQIRTYTLDILQSEGHEKFVRTIVNNLNAKALGLKHTMAVWRMEAEERRKHNAEVLETLAADVTKLAPEVLEAFPREVASMQEHVKQMQAASDLVTADVDRARADVATLVEAYAARDTQARMRGQELVEEIERAMETVLPGFRIACADLQSKIESLKNIPSVISREEALNECAQALKELWSQHAFALTIDPAHFQEIRFDLQTYLSTKENAGTTEQLDRVKADILRFYQMLRLSLPDVAVKWETEVRTLEALDPFRLGLIRESLQLEAANARSLAAWDETYREQLAEYLRQLGDDDSAETLRPRIHDLTRMPIIRESDFVKLDQEIQDHLTTRYAKEQSQATIVQNVSAKLQALGYAVADSDGNQANTRIAHGETVYLPTRWPEYRVMMKINSLGELVTRLVRVAGTPQEAASTTEYQKQKDAEVAKSWCRDFDEFRASLAKDGIQLDVRHRREPEEEGVQVVVLAGLQNAERPNERKKLGERER